MNGRNLKLIPMLVLAGALFTASGAYAKDNLCAECHTASEIAAFGNVLHWEKSVYQESATLCPGMRELKKETYFTESRLLKYDDLLDKMEHETRRYPEYIREDLDKYSVQYSDMLGATPSSIDGFAAPNLKIKKSIHGVYDTINKIRDDYKMEKVLGFGLAGAMLASLLFFLGLKNTL